MRLVLSTFSLASLGGSETYLLTLANGLERLGHEVTVYASELGEMAIRARAGGTCVVGNEDALPAAPDALIVQDAVSSLELADRYPRVSQLFISHADAIDLQAPPQLPGLVSAVVVFNDRVQRRMRALAQPTEIVRMRQPVDVDWFAPSSSIHNTPQQLLVLSNYMRGQRREILEGVCAELRLRCHITGAHATPAADPRPGILAADIVVGYGRSILEAMACGRAAYVYDHKGGDGWVTPGSYPLLEADGFGGRATPQPLDAERLRSELTEYRPEMGIANRDLVVGMHSAHTHANDVVAVLRRLPRSARATGQPLRELARINRRQWHAESRVAALMSENERLRSEVSRLHALADQHHAWGMGIFRTRRYRLGATLVRPLDALRNLAQKLRNR